MQSLPNPMLPPDIESAIAAIHDAPPHLVLVFAGAGSQALYWLHAVAGSSRTLLEAIDAYAPAALSELLGTPPARAVSPATAIAMAERAARRAAQLETAGLPTMGVSCTAAIATDRPRRGAERCLVAVRSAGRGRLYDLTMTKGRRDRPGEEELCSRLIIRAIAHACNVTPPVLPLLHDDQLLEEPYDGP